MCLLFFSLLLVPCPAHAQYQGDWTVTDQNGQPVSQNNDGSYPLSGLLAGTGTCTYPSDLSLDYFYEACVLNPNYFPYLFDGTPDPNRGLTSYILVSGWAKNNSEGSGFYWNGSQNEAINGTTTTSVSVPLTLTFTYTGTGTPPDHLDVLVSGSINASAWVDGSASLDSSALSTQSSVSDGLGESLSASATPSSPNGSQVTSGLHLLRLPVSGGVVHVSAAAQLSVTETNLVPYAANGEAQASGGAFVSVTAQIDNYKVTLSRDGARGETQDADGTKHGDTIYSYIDTETPATGLAGTGGSPITTDNENWQTFQPEFIGDWNFPQGSTPYWEWTPSESDDTSTLGKVSMHYRNYGLLNGKVEGKDSPETRTVSYSVTDPLGATATANYILTVHDPYEDYIDNHRVIKQNITEDNYSLAFTSVQGAPSGQVSIVHSDTWEASVSCDFLVDWIVPGTSANVTYSFTASSGASANVGPYTPGYTVWAETYNLADEYYGTVKVWDAGGYVGTQPYDEIIPTGHAGIEATQPVWTGTGPDPGNPFPPSP